MGYRQPDGCPEPQKHENWQIKTTCQFLYTIFPLPCGDAYLELVSDMADTAGAVSLQVIIRCG
jgi:hypothetical protein